MFRRNSTIGIANRAARAHHGARLPGRVQGRRSPAGPGFIQTRRQAPRRAQGAGHSAGLLGVLVRAVQEVLPGHAGTSQASTPGAA